MGTFAQGSPSFAIKGKSGLVAVVMDWVFDTLRRMQRTPVRGAGATDQAIQSDMEEIGVISRTLVQASMDAAHSANLQRQQVVTVLKIEERIRAAATVNLEDSTAAARQMEQVAREVETGTQTIEATNRGMSEMVKTVAAGVILMDRFAASIGEVNRAVRQIGGIARQTNLLALNAAVEASHAGARGEGFNVIAQEIRLLADRTSTATSEIGTTIGEMAAHAAAAGAAMEAGRSAASTSIEETGRVQESLEGMRTAIVSLLKLSKQIASASAEQLAASDEVAATVTVVNEMVARSTMDADSAAEMSIKMVAGAERVHAHLRGWSDVETSRRNKGRRAPDRVLLQVETQKAGVLAALSMMRAECAQHGPGIVHGTMQVKEAVLPGLYFGGVPATDGEPWVDAVNERTGCGATVFVLSEGTFVRVVTNVKLPSGDRATGTVLNPKGLAVAALKKGMSYFGAVYVLGNPFVAGYEPVFSGQGQVIGALYVGRALKWDRGLSGEGAD